MTSSTGTQAAGGRPIRVAVVGASGKMGRQTVRAVEGARGMTVSGYVDRGDRLDSALSAVDVAVIFSSPSAAEAQVLSCVKHGVHAVVGTTGWTPESLDRVREALGDKPRSGVLVAPNFAIGAVLLMRFAQQAALHFESVEIIEMHHADKVDAPSGTARHTAEEIAEARRAAGIGACPDATSTGLEGARGAEVDGIRVHAVRLSGLMAHEEVLLGGPGELLTLRHDSFDRASFMPGVLLAIRAVAKHPGLTIGLEHYVTF